jgi:beta-barrel assembly-enhancing protease
MRTFSRLFVGIVCATMSLSAIADGKFDFNNLLGNITKAVKGTSEQDEIHIGQDFAATLLGAKPLVADQHLQRYVNALGRWLALQTERPDLPWTFGVLDDAGFNAFATPGGYIFVTKGLVMRMHNEAELAGVLAHEIGHVLRKHHLHAAQKAAGFSAISDVFSAAGKGGSEKAKEAIVDLTRKLYTSGLDKSDEFEADRIGVVIAARAGYDAYGLPSVLQALQAQNAQDADFALLFKTHPAPAARIEQLNKLMQNKFDGLQGSSGKPIKDRLVEFSK